jgi:hypothetical protein
MPAVKLRATTILSAFEEAQTELVGRSVVLTDGKAATVETVWLDEVHGLRISIRGHYGKWPISIIKFAEGYSSRVPRLTEAVVRENYAVVSDHSGPASLNTGTSGLSTEGTRRVPGPVSRPPKAALRALGRRASIQCPNSPAADPQTTGRNAGKSINGDVYVGTISERVGNPQWEWNCGFYGFYRARSRATSGNAELLPRDENAPD